MSDLFAESSGIDRFIEHGSKLTQRLETHLVFGFAFFGDSGRSTRRCRSIDILVHGRGPIRFTGIDVDPAIRRRIRRCDPSARENGSPRCDTSRRIISGSRRRRSKANACAGCPSTISVRHRTHDHLRCFVAPLPRRDGREAGKTQIRIASDRNAAACVLS